MIEDIGNSETRLLTVGDEFIAWAETYWKLDLLFDNSVKNPAEKGGEVCPYSVLKPILIEKINSLIKNKLSL